MFGKNSEVRSGQSKTFRLAEVVQHRLPDLLVRGDAAHEALAVAAGRVPPAKLLRFPGARADQRARVVRHLLRRG